MKVWLSIRIFLLTFLLGSALFFALASSPPVVVAQTQPPTATTTTRVIKIPAPPGAKDFGYALDYDGKTLVVGAPKTDSGDRKQIGALYVYDLDPKKPDAWQLTATLTITTAADFTLLGEEVAVEDDVIVAGAPRAQAGSVSQLGFVAFYERTAENPLWQRTVITNPNPKVGPFSNFGQSIALENGVAYIGAPGADVLNNDGNILGANRGAVFTYGRINGEPGTWQFPIGEPIHDELGQFNDLFGSAVAASNGALLVGAENGDIEVIFSNEGIAYFYPSIAAPAEEIHRQIGEAENSDQFGHAVALDNEGDTPLMAIGGYNIQRDGNSGVGGVMIKQNAGGTMVYASDGKAYDFFGLSVAVHKGVVVVGAPDADNEGFVDQGAVYRFEAVGTEIGAVWLETAKYTAPSFEDGGFLGRSLALYDGLVIAGANGADGGNGAVYLFVEEVVEPGTQAFLPVVVRMPPSTGILANNSLVKDGSGARIGAVAGTVSQPLSVYIQKSGAPTLPLTNTVVVVGDYFKLGANELVYSPVDKPFLVGLPVPDGVDPSTLAAALLIPEGGAEKAGHDDTEWTHIYGSYDPATRLFAFTLSQLTAEGVHAVLVSHSSHQLLPFDPNAVVNSGTVNSVNTPATSFDVYCEWTIVPTAACSDANVAALKSQLFAAYTNFRGLGFREPALNRGVAAFTEGGEKPSLALLDRFYSVYIHPAPCDGAVGRFSPTTRTIMICVKLDVGIDSSVNRTVRHELFHAIQYAYPGLQADWIKKSSNWVLEGTAAAAENSTASLARTADFDLRDIDHRLSYSNKADVVAYETQDFWVYLGQEQGVQLNYLIPIFEAGSDLADVNGPMGGNLGGNYWNWVKNQYYEKSNTLNGALQSACSAEEPLATHVLDGYSSADSGKPPWVGSLDRLSAKVYWIGIDDAIPTLYAGVTGAASIRYKIYKDGAGGCTAVPDSNALEFENLTSADTLIVVIANTSIEAPASYQLRLESGGE